MSVLSGPLSDVWPAPSRRRSLAADRSRIAFCLAVALLALLPVAGLAWFALGGSGAPLPAFIRTVLPRAGGTTLLLLAGVGAIAAVTGIGTAFLVARCRFAGRRFFEWALLLPLAMPTYVMAYAWLDVVHPLGAVPSALRGLLGLTDPRALPLPDLRSTGGAIFVIGFVLYPYVYLPVRALLMMRASLLSEAARMLGAGPFRIFVSVTLPAIWPAAAVGLSLVLLETLNDIGASDFLGVRTLTVAVYTSWTVRGSIEGAAQIALAMLAIVLVLMLAERHARRRLSSAAPGRGTRPAADLVLGRRASALAAIACAVPVILGFGIPGAYLAAAAATRLAARGVPPGLAETALNSLAMAGLAALVTVALGLALTQANRTARSALVRPLMRVGAIGYAIPGTVLAVGLLVPLAGLDNFVADAARALTGRSIGLVLIGSGAALLIAYCLRFLAIAIGGIEAGFSRISRSLDGAAASLGAAPARVAQQIHAPLLAAPIATAAILVFVDAMKELPATLLLRPLNFETLATSVYGEAARGTHEDGAIAALMIVAVGLAPVIRLARIGRIGPN